MRLINMNFEFVFAIIVLINACILFILPSYAATIFLILAVGFEVYLCMKYYKEMCTVDYVLFIIGILFCIMAINSPKKLILSVLSIGFSLCIRFSLAILLSGEKDEFDKLIDNTIIAIKSDMEKEIFLVKSRLKNEVSQEIINEQIILVKRELFKKNKMEIDLLKNRYELEIKRISDEQKVSKKNIDVMQKKYEEKIRLLEVNADKMANEAVKQLTNELEEVNKNLIAIKNRNKELEEKNAYLQKKIIDQQDEFIKKTEEFKIYSVNKMIHNEEIHEYLKKALNEADYEVCIMSPWIDKRVIDSLPIDMLIKRKVRLKIVYGIKNSKNGESIKKDSRLKEAEELLKEMNKKYGNIYFKYKYFSSHSKLIICDEKYYIITSCNPLSNKGENWEEIGEISSNKENIKKYKEYYFKF